MKLLISRGRFERIAAGLSPVERDMLAERVQLYPDDIEPDWVVDQDRIGARYEQLRCGAPDLLPSTAYDAWDRPPASSLAPWLSFITDDNGPTEMHWTHEVPLADASTLRLPAPWEEIAPGVWVGPPGQPPPPLFDHTRPPDPDPTTLALALEDLVAGEIVNDDSTYDTARRYFLNETVVGVRSPFDELNDCRKRLSEMDLPRPMRLEAGELALSTIARRLRQGQPARGAAKDPAAAAADLAWLTGIPIVPSPDLATDAWRLVDAADPEKVLAEGVVPGLAAYKDVMRRAVDELAAECGVPRELLLPDADWE